MWSDRVSRKGTGGDLEPVFEASLMTLQQFLSVCLDTMTLIRTTVFVTKDFAVKSNLLL